MYTLPYFMEKNSGRVKEFMCRYPFVTLCGTDVNGTPVATQVPVLLKEKGETLLLQGHMMRQTSHYKAFAANPHVLAMFTGPHCYVSASWYTNPQQGSTWNYMTVQAKGLIHFLEEEALTDILRETTTLFENNQQSPASFDQLSEEYVARLRKAIAGFEIQVTMLEKTFKLSQNRDEASYHNIIARLRTQDGNAQEIAREMSLRAPELF